VRLEDEVERVGFVPGLLNAAFPDLLYRD